MAYSQTKKETRFRWQELLIEAITVPGIVHSCYSRFYRYSLGNQFLAYFQCKGRGIPYGQLSTYKGWQKIGRQVKKGEKAITLLMPIMIDKKKTDENGEVTKDGKIRIFVERNLWFVLSQTDGEDVKVPEKVNDWDRDMALQSLGIEMVQFEYPDANCQGYAFENKVAVSPIAARPEKTLFHELAHVVLGHTAKGMRIIDDETLSLNNVEVEAECTALLICDALGVDGQEYSRAYIQNWLRGEQEISEASSKRIFAAADKILRAGFVDLKETEDAE